MRSSLGSALFGIAALAATFAGACRTSPGPVGTVSSISVGTGGAPSTSSVGGAVATGTGGYGGELVVPGVPLVGVEPNPRHTGSGEPPPSEVMLAELMVLAAGVRSVTLDVPWRELQTDVALDALSLRVGSLRAKGLRVVLVLDVVDGRVDGRPQDLAMTAWDAAATGAALDAVLAGLATRIGTELDAFVLGRDVDVYEAAHAELAASFANRIAAATSYAQSVFPPTVPVAVGLSFGGPAYDEIATGLANLGTASAFRYAPGLGAAAVAKASAAAKDLDAMIALAASRPIFLTGVRFTTDPSLGATADAQAQLFQAFFAALEPRGAYVRTVNVARLHDFGAEACALRALEQGLPQSDPSVRFDCASGLRDASGEAKLSWQAFLKAAAANSAP
jgi:hypothetical protein